MTVPIILASGSPIRAQLLAQVGIPFEVERPRIDESALKDSLLAEGQPHRNVADALAEMKALRVSQKRPGRLVLGSDQVLSCDGTLYSKPADRADAARQLAALAGRSHQLITAAVVAEDGKPAWRHVEAVSLHVRPLSAQSIEAYLDIAWPAVAGCVGGYMLEAEGLRLFTRIEGDYHAGLGLPVLPVLSYLAARGIVAP